MIFHRLFKIFLRFAFGALLDLRVEGLENIPRKGPFILAHNHMNWVDATLASSLMPRDIVSMSKRENLFIPILGGLMRLYGAFPVRRGEVDREALNRAVSALSAGYALLMVPEGTRGKDWRLKPGKDGLAFVALRSGVPIVLMAITGSEKFWSEIRGLRRTPTRVVIGEPFYLQADPQAGDEFSREDLREMTKEVMYRLAEMLPPEYRGAYSDMSQASARFIVPYREMAKVA